MFSWFNSLRYRLMVFFGGISIVFCIGFVSYLYWVASDRLLTSYATQLATIGRSIETTISNNLYEREREILLLSKRSIFINTTLDHQTVRRSLDILKDSYEYYSWIGFADLSGVVKDASDGLLEGYDVSKRPWFIHGVKGPFVGDVHEAVLLSKDKNNPLRLVDFAAPVYDGQKRLIGVVASHANWKWVQEVINSVLPDNAQANSIDVQILGPDGLVLYPFSSMNSAVPKGLLQQDISDVLQWPDGRKYLTSVTTLKSNYASQLGWRVVVRIPKNVALKEITFLHRQLLWLSVVAILLCMWFVYRMSISVSLPLEKLVAAVTAIQYGKDDVSFQNISGLKEISFLTDAIHKMTMSLLIHEKTLLEMNQTLERKVTERTKELQQVNAELERLSRRDPLTDLRNRRSAAEHLENEFTRMKRFGSPYTVLMMDIDHFKKINDTHGHDVGDIVLVEVARILERAIRKADVVARYGGEEFLIILTGTDNDDALHVAEKIRFTVEQTEFNIVKHVTMSVGVSTVMETDNDAYSVVRRSDSALYLAKASGRNKVCAYKPEQNEI